MLKNRVIAVTGAAKGLGLRITGALAAEGADLVLLSRPSADLDKLAQEYPQALVTPCDVSRPESVADAFSQVAARFGRLDGLINNAALCQLHSLEEMSNEAVRAEVDTNLLGPLYCMRAALPLLRAAGGGDIINVSSESANVPIPFLTLYGATKAGLENLSAGLRLELRKDKIRITVLRLGRMIESRISAGWDPARRDRFREETARTAHPVHEVGHMRPETIAAMVVHILGLPPETTVELTEIRGT